jgi:hypothetical protein
MKHIDNLLERKKEILVGRMLPLNRKHMLSPGA